MPTYEYRCSSCGHHFEQFSLKMTDASSVECPKCEGVADRLISGGAGLLFKGSGFYITDYRSDSYRKAEKKDAPAGEKPAADRPPGKPAPASEKPAKPKSEPKKGSK